MKRSLLILALVAIAMVTITSCASQRSGCKATQGYLGYGSR